jgi:hypothetical protein
MSRRKRIRTLPSAKYLRACFSYNPDTGELLWRERPREHFPSCRGWRIFNTRNAGKIAGTIHIEGYCSVKVGPEIYLAHRVIWKLVTRHEPTAQIDHKDGNRLNNAWRNLREAIQTEQNWNASIHRDNTSGFRGVSRARQKWVADIMTNGVRRYIGVFDTPEEASAAYETAARDLHRDFYRLTGRSDSRRTTR